MENFLEDNWPYIIIVVLTFLTLILVFNITGVDFNPKKNKYIKKIVTVETFFGNVPDLKPKKKSLGLSASMEEWAKEHKMYDLINLGKDISEKVAIGIEAGGHDAYRQNTTPEERCGGLSDKLCKMQNTCVHIIADNETKCVLGNKEGPLNDAYKPIGDFHYYNEGICYGKQC